MLTTNFETFAYLKRTPSLVALQSLNLEFFSLMNLKYLYYFVSQFPFIFSVINQMFRRLSYFFVSIMQQDVYIDYTALALTLSLQVFSLARLPRRIDCLAPPPVNHVKMEASR